MPTKNLPNEWFEIIEPGVRRLTPPGIAFEWLDLAIDVAGPGMEVIERCLDRLGISREVMEVLSESSGESVRYRHSGTSILRLELPPTTQPGGEIEDGLVITAVTKDEHIFTIGWHRLKVIDGACESIAQNKDEHVTPLGALSEIGDEFIDHIRPIVRTCAFQLDQAESELEEKGRVKESAIGEIRRSLLTIDRSLDPIQTAIGRSMLDFSAELRERDVASLRGLLGRANGLEQRVHSQLDRVRVLSDREHMMSMDDMSTSMYRLSWIATIFLPLTFVTGLLGINVEGIPDAKDPNAFLVVCGLLILTAVGTGIGLLIAIRMRGKSR
jgi:Mg2+ and Co2+ transporter CorA